MLSINKLNKEQIHEEGYMYININQTNVKNEIESVKSKRNHEQGKRLPTGTKGFLTCFFSWRNSSILGSELPILMQKMDQKSRIIR